MMTEGKHGRPSPHRWQIGAQHARVLIILVGLAMAAAAYLAWHSRPREAAEVPRVPTGPSVRPGVALALAGSDPLPSGSQSPQQILVHVLGRVKRPGVVRVPAGSRVIDAVVAAGGARGSVGDVNLARVIGDGEQVYVGERPAGSAQPAGAAANSRAGPGSGSGSGSGSSSGSSSGSGTAETVDLNTATLEQLDSLPRIGLVTAQRILDWRSAHGRFSTVDELGEISGIGERTLEQLRDRVRV